MLKAVLFDLDGTLLDTGNGVVRSVEYTIKKMGFRSLTQEELQSFVGPPIKEKLKTEFNLDEATAIEGMKVFRKHYGEEDLYIADPYDGIEDLLVAIHKLNIKTGVATYKREDQAIKLLQRFNLADKFDVIHGSDKEGKLTKADVVNQCILDLNVARDEVVLVGDSDNDAIGAKQVGVKFIGVVYGFGFKSKDDIECFDNIGVAETCRDVINYIL